MLLTKPARMNSDQTLERLHLFDHGFRVRHAGCKTEHPGLSGRRPHLRHHRRHFSYPFDRSIMSLCPHLQQPLGPETPYPGVLRHWRRLQGSRHLGCCSSEVPRCGMNYFADWIYYQCLPRPVMAQHDMPVSDLAARLSGGVLQVIMQCSSNIGWSRIRIRCGESAGMSCLRLLLSAGVGASVDFPEMLQPQKELIIFETPHKCFARQSRGRCRMCFFKCCSRARSRSLT